MTTHYVVGGQFGSEAKGHVAAQLVKQAGPRGNNACIRIGGPNAGHSVVDATGRVWAFRTIPVAAPISSWDLFISAGSEIDIEVLHKEVTELEQAGFDIKNRLYIDAQATVISEKHKQTEQTEQLTQRVGSTAKGIGAARADRLMRNAKTAHDHRAELSRYGYVCDTGADLRERSRDNRSTLVIEGTQGYGLGLHAGHYPHCTAGDCRAVDFAAQAGLHPTSQDMVWVVMRTHPIRVAGNSGPLRFELTWGELSTETNGYIKPELTTVTKKQRRVGRWDRDLAAAALDANGGVDNPSVQPVLTFVDYLDPALAGATELAQLYASPAYATIARWQHDLGVLFSMFTTGPNTCIWGDQ